MTTRISTNNLDATITAQFSPKISGIAIADNAYTVLDDTAVNIAGGFVVISGSNFVSGCSVLIGSVVATSVSFVNSTTIRAQVPAQTAGSYTVYVTNPDGGLAIRINGLNYSATPTWSTTSPLPGGQINNAISIQLSATSTGSVTYALQAGSSLPAGVTLSSSGLLSGTVTGISADTTYNFTVVATDTELQDTPQAFSITITANDPNFRNTTLLLSANTPGATFVTDASTNAFNLSVFGDTRPNTFGPYTPGYYSNFFDGTGDFLTIANGTAADAAMNFSTNNFTIECWVYLTSYGGANYAPIFSNQFLFYVGSAGQVLYFNGSTNVVTGTSGDVPLNSWTHLACVRNGTTVTIYVNGISRASATVSASISNGSLFAAVIGMNASTITFPGFISNLRVVNGTAVYTTNFTPSTAPLTAVANTSLLTCQSNRFIDSSTNDFAITRNGDVRVDGFDPFVPAADTASLGSAYFDGTGDYLSFPASSAMAMGTGDYTIEFWIYLIGTGDFTVIDNQGSGGNMQISRISGALYHGSATTWNYTFTNNVWTHIAFARSGTNLRLFANGVLQQTLTNSNSIGSAAGTNTIGIRNDNFYPLNGYLSDIRVVKGTAVYTNTFTPGTTPLTAIANTSLLTLQTNQPHNNNQFVDRSTNNFLITRNGNTTPGSFSPYAGGWSNYFDGSGDSLTVPSNAAFSFGTGDFTVEFWAYYPAVSNSNGKMVVDSRPASTNGSFWLFGVTNVGLMSFTTMTTGGITLTDSTARPNQWVHYAATRSGTSLRLFANGTQVASATNSDNISSSGLFIGTNAFSSTATDTFWLGYISNLRIVKGTAVYTSAFTPPIQPLAPIANTSLLTCADNRLIDDSINNFTITRNGDVSVQKFSPFSMQTQIAPNSHSVFFDGTGDFLTTTMPALGTGSFTVEFWFYPTDPTRAYLLLDKAFRDGNFSLQTDYLNAGAIYLNVAGSSYTFSFTPPIVNQWNHVAISRDSGALRFFLNGVQLGTTQANSGSVTTGTLYIGGASTTGSGYLTTMGYISNLRMTTTAVYTANFTPSTSPLTAIANTSLLACQSPTIRDNSTNAFAITANGDARPTPINPFGYTNPSAAAYTTTALGGSMYFDGTGDYLTAPSNSLLTLGSGDYTVEAWVYLTGTQTTSFGWGVFGTYNVTVVDNGWTLTINHSNSGQSVRWVINNAVVASAPTPYIPLNAWTHIAVTRSGTGTNNTKIFINGVQSGQATDNSNNTATGPTYIGSQGTGQLLTGYVSDARLVKGQAVYTSSFVPPAAPLDAVRNTTLLLRGTAAGVHDGTMNNNLETIGDSRINTSITRFTGRSSIFFDGTGDYVRSVPAGTHTFGTGNFTIEMWVYPQSATGYQCMVQIGTTNPYIFLGINTGSTGTPFMWNDGNVIVGSQNFTLNTWQHWAIVRNNGTVTMYLNGTSIGSASYTGNLVDNTGVYLGSNSGGTQTYVGYMSDVRLTRGIARYTANFTAPTGPFVQY